MTSSKIWSNRDYIQKISQAKAGKFHKQKQVTDIFKVNVEKIAVSDRVSCNNANVWRHIVVIK